MLKISKTDFLKFVDLLIGAEGLRTVGVVKSGQDFVFSDLEKASDLRLDYNKPTLMSPGKKYFLPAKETLVKFDGENAEPVLDNMPIILIGVKPYDVWAIKLMDKAFAGTEPVDPNYLARRRNSMIVAIDDLHPYENSFCPSMGTAFTGDGFDLLLTDIGEEYLVKIGSHLGHETMLSFCSCFPLEEPSVEDLEKANTLKEAALKKYKLEMPASASDLSELLEKNYESPLWEEMAKKCLACGKCNLVCPTCVCFDIKDEVEFDLKTGERNREWCGCMLSEFATVAMGHNFRSKVGDRLRHRIFRKLNFLKKRFGLPGCVGCGRCIAACKADVASPVEAIKKLKGEAENENK